MLIDVALPLPLFRNFTYEVDDADRDRARVGMRAVVPFRNRKEVGLIVGVDVAAPTVTAKRVDALPDSAPVMSSEMLSLARWLAEYYIVPLGVAIRAMLPAALSSHATPDPVRRTRRVAELRRDLPSIAHSANLRLS